MNIKEPARETPVVAKADVLVVGAGPAGIIAAMAVGQAAGTSAALVIKEKQSFKNLNMKRLQNILRRDKVIIDA